MIALRLDIYANIDFRFLFIFLFDSLVKAFVEKNIRSPAQTGQNDERKKEKFQV
jgi:hypothetical protein